MEKRLIKKIFTNTKNLPHTLKIQIQYFPFKQQKSPET